MRPETMVKKVRGSHRSDLTKARKFTIVRSVAIALPQKGVYAMYIPRKNRASTAQVTSMFVNLRTPS
jgi:hypothetical protein